MKSVAVVIPAYNEEACIDELVRRLQLVFAEETAYQFTVFIVENGSSDGTWRLIQQAAASDSRFIGVQLSRNFGADGGITAGLEYVTQDSVVFMTADLQDPPEAIPSFLREWENGVENVYGIVLGRQGTGPIRKLNSRLFYWLTAKLTDERIPRNASDFRLLDRRAYEAVRSLTERNRMVRGLAAWVGFTSLGIPIKRPPRFAGTSKATTSVVLQVATRGIFSNSTKPLRLITLSGIGFSVSAILSIFILGLLWVVRGVPFAGFGTLVALSLLAFGLLALMIGVVAEYVGLIYDEVKLRPNFIVRQTTVDDGAT